LQQLWESLEMGVARNQGQVVFEGDGSDPNVVYWHHRSRTPQLNLKTSVVICSLPRRQYKPYCIRRQKSMKISFVLFLPGATENSSLVLPQNGKWNANFFAQFKHLRKADVTPE